jgi:hypothetical protein
VCGQVEQQQLEVRQVVEGRDRAVGDCGPAEIRKSTVFDYTVVRGDGLQRPHSLNHRSGARRGGGLTAWTRGGRRRGGARAEPRRGERGCAREERALRVMTAKTEDMERQGLRDCIGEYEGQDGASRTHRSLAQGRSLGRKAKRARNQGEHRGKNRSVVNLPLSQRVASLCVLSCWRPLT